MNYKHKIGDIVIGIKDDPDCPKIRIKGKVGEIVSLRVEHSYPYRVEFKEQVDFEFNKQDKYAYYSYFKEDEITNISALKLKKLLIN